MSTTPNLNLFKPAPGDRVDPVADIAANMDLIDTAVAAKETPAGATAKVAAHAASATAHIGTYLALSGGTLTDRLTLDSATDPTTGEGVLLNIPSYSVDVGAAGLNLLRIDHHNLHTVSGEHAYYAVNIVTDSDALDTAAGIAVTNNGKSDNIYLSVKGKSGATASGPTGLGIDLNRSGSGENSSANAGFGILAFDWSTTNQGTAGPVVIAAYKINNPDSDHKLVRLRANRRALSIETPEGGSYDGTQPIVQLLANSGAGKWQLLASGDQIISNGQGLYFSMPGGNQAYILCNNVRNMVVRGGNDGISIRDNADAITVLRISDSASTEGTQNVGIRTNSFGSGSGVLGILNAAVVPTVAPTGGGVLYVESGALKYLNSSGQVSPLDGGYGFPWSVDPGLVRGADALPVVASNGALFARCKEGGTISKIGLEVVVSSGNISVAAYRNSGSGRTSVPGTRLQTSGAVACPAAGYREIALGGSITVNPGDWLALSADNATATFRSLLAGAASSNLGLGRQMELSSAAHPCPSPVTSPAATIGRNIVLIGVT